MAVSLFIPCFVEHLRPEAGLACAQILDALGVQWRYPRNQACCGQPAFNVGMHAATLPAARQFLKTFGDSAQVVAPSGSCVAMVRRYPKLPGLSESERADLGALAGRTREFCDFLAATLGDTNLPGSWEGRVCFQDSCHTLRELGVAAAPRRLLAGLRGLAIVDQPELECCGFGGLYSLKLPELSCAQADERLEALVRADCDTLVGTDVSCMMHIEGRAQARGIALRTLHVAELLAVAMDREGARA